MAKPRLNKPSMELPTSVAAAAVTQIEAFNALVAQKASQADAVLLDDFSALAVALQEVACCHGVACDAVWRYAGDAVRPTCVRGWSWNRAYRKPRGYPGDFRLIQWIYDGVVETAGVGALFDRTFLAAHAARAVQNRRLFLGETLWQHAQAHSGSPLRILSLGSGPAQELVDLLERAERVHHGGGFQITCVDIDPRALTHASRAIEAAGGTVTPLRADLRDLTTDDLPRADVAYCAGVFDYLDDGEIVALLDTLYEVIAHNGVVIAGNFVERRPTWERFGMDHIIQWLLRYRDEDHLRSLGTTSRFGVVDGVQSEPLGLNLFMTLRR